MVSNSHRLHKYTRIIQLLPWYRPIVPRFHHQFRQEMSFGAIFKDGRDGSCVIIGLISDFQPIQAADLIDSEFRQGMSSRQKNKAKRMAKLVAKQRSRDMDPNEKRYRCTCWTAKNSSLLIVQLKVSKCLVSVSNDSFEGEPEEKRRKTTNVVIDQPATELKVVIDNVPCSSSLEEVRVQP